MNNFEYDMSIIIPVYNAEKYLHYALDSVINQDFDFNRIEVIAINDGSTDNSLNVLEQYSEKYNNIKIISQENSGVSCARNKGISEAKGKYLLFLDSDDELSKNVVSSIVKLFDEHYEEIDMVLYKIVPMTLGVKKKSLHYRYDILKVTGIYNLNEDDYIYSCITNICYCVKNKLKDNVKFDTSYLIHEDQKYACDILKNNLKIGFVDECEYIYRQQSSSATHSFLHAYYIFDKTTQSWEELFGQYKKGVPKYFQALFINDINWKMKSDKLKPYQFEGKKFDEEYNRILNLLDRVDDEVIINHPALSEINKYYFINCRKNKKIRIVSGNGISALSIIDDNKLIYSTDSICLTFLKFKIHGKKIDIMGYIIDPALSFCKKPILYLNNLENLTNKRELTLKESSYCYYQSKTKVTNAWVFEITVNVEEIRNFNFIVKVDNATLKCFFKFNYMTPFCLDVPGRNVVFKGNRQYVVDIQNNCFYIKNKIKSEEKMYKKILNNYYFYNDKKRYFTRQLIKLASKLIKKNIWLYYDCGGVEKDNGYYQFIHDIKIKDGISRYYVSANGNDINKKIFSFAQRRKIIKFSSLKHKLYYCNAAKVITAFIEEKNCSPYTRKSYNNYSDLFNTPEVIYLQHGVLHAHMPWKFSLDRLLIDKEVISTTFEKENLINNYVFDEKNLICSGMPRYDFVSQDDLTENKILFAPSWRNYLIGHLSGKWIATEKKFIESKFYKETYSFLTSKRLDEILKKYNYTLDFKLHPIFKCYEHLYDIKSDRINIGSSTTKNSDYKICITDYSSFVFDFVYLKKTIVYFFPDYDLFKAGLNIYREIDLPFEKGFGKFMENSDDVIDYIEKLLKNNCVDDKKFVDRNNGLFLYNDNNQRDRIYDNIKNNL